jgi:2-keto-3-deoxy-L-rhamnonate aldolase RhmA
MVETTEALTQLDDIVSTPGFALHVEVLLRFFKFYCLKFTCDSGLDAIYVGPADLSLSLGLNSAPYSNTADAFVRSLDQIVASCKKHKVAPGCHAVGVAGAVEARRAQGFLALTIQSDITAMKSGVAVAIAAAKAGRHPK